MHDVKGTSNRRSEQWALMGCTTVLLLVAACGGGGSSTPVPPPDPPPAATSEHKFTFESGPVRPIALSADGTRLFVANTSAGTLDILSVTPTGVQFESSVAVGLEPVTVAVRSPGEVWVVNHLSDSISIVDVASTPSHVTKTLLVGDEPRDLLFAGISGQRAFVTTAHRGQQRSSPALAGVPGAGDPQLTTSGIGRADVWVFDTQNLGDTLGGRPIAILGFNADTPRALAATADGRTVYVAAHHSGNRTTAISSLLPCPGFDVDTPCTVSGNSIPGSALGPATNYAGLTAPRVGLIAKTAADGSWRDARNRDWSGVVRFSLPDNDVFAFDAETLATTAAFPHVGTTLFNMAINPRSGAVYVSNTEARNDLRLEGPGTFAGVTLQGHLAESRISVLAAGTVAPRHLNKHIPYATLPAPASVKQSSLATPVDLLVSGDGTTVYVAAFGSSMVGVFPSAALENDSFDPTQLSSAYLTVSGGGPSGLALDETRSRLYVSTRFDNGVSVINLTTRSETSHTVLVNPERKAIVDGRRFLYDANASSSNGEASCASCHIFGNADQLAWDLGNPDDDGVVTPINIKLALGASGSTINGSGNAAALHPMKGPMGTQTLRGMVNHGPMHWRGDRVDGFFGKDTRTAPPFDSELAFKNFILAFQGLLGRGSQFPAADMQSFTNFALAIGTPPNPIRNLDNSLTTSQARGRSFFMGCDGLDSITGSPAVCGADGRPVGAGHFSDGVPAGTNGFTCEGCHVLSAADGFFGTDGQSSFEALPQTMKIPQLRNMYEKVGMFGVASNAFENPGDNGNKGPQMRGYGFANDASVDSLFRFFQGTVFNSSFNGRVGFAGGDTQRRDMEAFMLAFDSDLAPVVGQQITLDNTNAAIVGPRIDLLRARAGTAFVSKMLGGQVTECDLVVRAVINSRATTFVMRADGSFARDDGASPISDSALRQLASVAGQQLTYTCMPPGWAPRI